MEVSVTKKVWDDMASEWQNVPIATLDPVHLSGETISGEDIVKSFANDIAKGLTIGLGLMAWFLALIIVFD